jgi:aspartate carbamoyltransferase catalytic subunit
MQPDVQTVFPRRHLLGIEGLSRPTIEMLLDMAEQAVEVSRQVEKKRSILRGRTQINLFYEASTRKSSPMQRPTRWSCIRAQ